MKVRMVLRLVSEVAAVLLMFGCSTVSPVDSAALETADYGSYPSNFESAVKSYFETMLKDPYSAHYKFGKPYRAYLRAAPVQGGKPTIFGYIIDVWVNARNSYGGYVGEKHYRVFLRDDNAVTTVTPNPWFSEPWYK